MKMISKYLLLLCLISSCQADVQLDAVIISAFSKEHLGKGFLFLTKDDHVFVEVCVDEWCDTFNWRGNKSDEKYWKYIALYEKNFGVAFEDQDFLISTQSIRFGDLEKNEFCHKKKDGELMCNWGGYAKNLGLKIGLVNYDLGIRCYVNRTQFNKLDWIKPSCHEVEENKNPFAGRY